jgi:hypothetical protein
MLMRAVSSLKATRDKSSKAPTDPQVYTPWDKFDVEEYVTRNYGRRLLEEDHLIIRAGATALKRSGIPLHSLHRVADVGAWPNFYPTMLFAPYISEEGSLDLIEYSPPNRAYAETIVSGDDGRGPLAGTWDKFEVAMAQEGGQWQDALREARSKARILDGTIYDLPESEYDAIGSYFVSESITDDPEKFREGVFSLVRAVKPGGFIMIAHMLGSKGWPAGEGTNFPALPVTAEDLEEVYGNIADVEVMQVSATPEARKGYRGMAVVVGRRKMAEWTQVPAVIM